MTERTSHQKQKKHGQKKREKNGGASRENQELGKVHGKRRGGRQDDEMKKKSGREQGRRKGGKKECSAQELGLPMLQHYPQQHGTAFLWGKPGLGWHGVQQL